MKECIIYNYILDACQMENLSCVEFGTCYNDYLF